MTSFSDIMKATIFKKGRGNFITPEDFGTTVTSASLRTELVNFASRRVLIHVARGLYYFPKLDSNGKQIKPTLYDIKHWYEAENSVKAFPSVEVARYILGLEKKHPNPAVFYSTGKLKKMTLEIGPEVIFQPMPKQFQQTIFKSEKIELIVVALNNIDVSSIDLSELPLSSIDSFEIEEDYNNIPVCLRTILQSLCCH